MAYTSCTRLAGRPRAHHKEAAMIRFVSLAALLVSIVGCASTRSGTAIQVTDVKALSGKWLGFATGLTGGAPNATELVINPDGTWTSRSGAVHQNGTLSISDGKINF